MLSVFLLLIVFISCGAGLAWYLLTHDKGEKEPIYALWVAAAFGLAGALVAGVLEGWMTGNLDSLAGKSGIQLLSVALLVGLIEEACKFIPLSLWIYKKRFFNEHTDGVIYFALAGLGFGLPENILYTLQYGTKTGMTRLLLTPLFHAAITGAVGYFLARQKMSKMSPLDIAFPLVGAIVLHGLYDFGLLSSSVIYQTLALVITFSLSVGLFLLFIKANEQDQDLGLSAVGHNGYCRSCGWANPAHHLYCTHCGKNA